MIRNNAALRATAEVALHGRHLPVANPAPISKKDWRKKKTHDKAKRRAMTAAELADSGLRAKEKAEKAVIRRAKRATRLATTEAMTSSSESIAANSDDEDDEFGPPL